MIEALRQSLWAWALARKPADCNLQLACKCYNHTLMSSIAYWRNGLYTQRSVHRVTEGSKLQANTRRSRRLIRIKCTISSGKLTSPKLRSTKLLWGRDKTDFVGNLMITLVKATRNSKYHTQQFHPISKRTDSIRYLYPVWDCELWEHWEVSTTWRKPHRE